MHGQTRFITLKPQDVKFHLVVLENDAVARVARLTNVRRSRTPLLWIWRGALKVTIIAMHRLTVKAVSKVRAEWLCQTLT